MSKPLTFFFLVAAVMTANSSIVGCAFSKNPKGKDSKDVIVQGLDEKDRLNESEFSVQLIETENFNEYYAKFSWPADKTVRVELQENGRILENSLKNNALFLVTGGSTRNFFVTVYNSFGGNVLSKEFPVTAPKDSEVIGVYEVERDEEWSNRNRVYFTPDAKVILNGFDLTISADRIAFGLGSSIETGGGIVAFTEKQLNGSSIFIKARLASGSLQVRLDGFHGRDGKSGDELDKKSGFADPYLPELKGFPAQNGKIHPRPKAEVDGCNNPRDGGPGKPGAKGTTGQNGENGGNTGSLKIELSSPLETGLVVEVIPRPGEPGTGGAGGIGRRGGEGGDAGAAEDHCQGGRKGPEGPRGPVGDRGKNGGPGTIGNISAPGLTIRK